MTGFKAFRYYIALKLHFTKEKFNVFENKGHIKGSYAAFDARNDKYLFEKLARKFPKDQDIIQFIVANLSIGNDNIIYGMEEAEENYIQWIKRKQSITHTFLNDINTIQLESEKNNYNLDQIINCTLNQFPVIIKLYLGKLICMESIVILNDFIPMIAKWKQEPSLILLENDILRIEKLKGFVKYNRDKIEKQVNEFLTTIY
ncbi:MAG: hypothetical protein ACO3UU_02090 [Minisyncoccia bacterium]